MKETNAKRLMRIEEHIIEVKCNIAKIEEHLRSINGFVSEQKEINKDITGKVRMAQGGIFTISFLVAFLTLAKMFGLW